MSKATNGVSTPRPTTEINTTRRAAHGLLAGVSFISNALGAEYVNSTPSLEFLNLKKLYAAWVSIHPDQFPVSADLAMGAYHEAFQKCAESAASPEKITELLNLAVMESRRDRDGEWDIASGENAIIALFDAFEAVACADSAFGLRA